MKFYFHEESFILAEKTQSAGIANSLTGDTLPAIMKKIVLTLSFLIFFAFNLSAQTEKIKGQKYILKGKLLQTVEIRLCGYFAFANVAEFEIINFSDSIYTRKKIPIIINCPEFKGKNFSSRVKYIIL